MFATGLALAHEKWRQTIGENRDAVFLLYARIHLLVLCPLRGAALTGLMLCIWRQLRGGPAFPAEPGHWLLVIQGAEVVIFAAWEFLNTRIGPDELIGFLPAWFTFSEMMLFDGFIVGLTVLAAVKSTGSRLWPAAFFSIALNQLSQIVHSALVDAFSSGAWFMNELAWSIGFRVVYSLPALFAILAAISDRRSRRPHDFFHWAGVTMIVLLVTIEWPNWIIWRHLFR